jgi:hypothetical protein
MPVPESAMATSCVNFVIDKFKGFGTGAGTGTKYRYLFLKRTTGTGIGSFKIGTGTVPVLRNRSLFHS